MFIAYLFIIYLIGTAAILGSLSVLEKLWSWWGDFFVVRSWKREVKIALWLALYYVLISSALPLAPFLGGSYGRFAGLAASVSLQLPVVLVFWWLHRFDLEAKDIGYLAITLGCCWMLLYQFSVLAGIYSQPGFEAAHHHLFG